MSKDRGWLVATSFDDLSKPDQAKLLAIRNENVEAHLRGGAAAGEEQTDRSMFEDACVHLQRVYRIVANRYARDMAEKIDYLKKAFDICKESTRIINI